MQLDQDHSVPALLAEFAQPLLSGRSEVVLDMGLGGVADGDSGLDESDRQLEILRAVSAESLTEAVLPKQ